MLFILATNLTPVAAEVMCDPVMFRYRNSRAEQPPRYSSNPSLNMSAASAPPQTRDRDRPPPYSPQR